MGIRPPNSRTIQVLSPASRRLLLRSVKLQIVRYEVSCRTGVLSVEPSASPEKQTLVLGVRYLVDSGTLSQDSVDNGGRTQNLVH
jgi:hypothetical protein